MQRVTFGYTLSGTPSLFTNGIQAMPVFDVERFNADPIAYCLRLGFEYDSRQGK